MGRGTRRVAGTLIRVHPCVFVVRKLLCPTPASYRRTSSDINRCEPIAAAILTLGFYQFMADVLSQRDKTYQLPFCIESVANFVYTLRSAMKSLLFCLSLFAGAAIAADAAVVVSGFLESPFQVPNTSQTTDIEFAPDTSRRLFIAQKD